MKSPVRIFLLLRKQKKYSSVLIADKRAIWYGCTDIISAVIVKRWWSVAVTGKGIIKNWELGIRN